MTISFSCTFVKRMENVMCRMHVEVEHALLTTETSSRLLLARIDLLLRTLKVLLGVHQGDNNRLHNNPQTKSSLGDASSLNDDVSIVLVILLRSNRKTSAALHRFHQLDVKCQ